MLLFMVNIKMTFSKLTTAPTNRLTTSGGLGSARLDDLQMAPHK
jgi:hypothetical protein